MVLEEIKNTISTFEGTQRAELIDFYYEIVKDKVENCKSIDSKRIDLILSVSNFVTPEERKSLMSKAINIKISQIRTFILENAKENFTAEKTHFSNISKWMQALIQEISNTFNPPRVSEAIAIEFHTKLIEELSLIFCSYEKFNSAGIQLLLDLNAYHDNFNACIKGKFSLYDKIKSNFLPGKCLPDAEIKEIYKNIKKQPKSHET